MTRRLLAALLGVALVALLLVAVPLGLLFAGSERERLEDDLRHDALALALLADERVEAGDRAGLQQLADRYDASTGARVVVVDGRGRRLADSDPLPADAAGDFSGRPEVAAALRGEEVVGTRRSDTLDTDLLYVAVPVATNGRVDAVVRLTYPVSVVERRIAGAWVSLGLLALAVLGLTSIVAVLLARSLARPLQDLATTAGALGSGDLSARAALPAKLPEVRVVAQAVNDTAARLERLVGAQQQFVADASHQLRSPLAALRLRLENLSEAADPATESDLAAALTEVRRLSRLVDGLLALARGDRGGAAPEPVDLVAVAEERRAAWTAYADERGVEVRVEAAPVRALATPGHVEQVLDNLLANALEVAPRGTAVTLSVRAAGDRAELVVADRGPGMTEEERAHAFDRFWRSPRARAAKGTGGSGLGLAIVAQLTAADGGEVGLRDVPGGGLAAVVQLRRAG